MEVRPLERDEIPRIWQIDRSETIEGIYALEDGKLVLKPEYFDAKGWPPGEEEAYTPHLLECWNHGGSFFGAFERDDLVGVAVLEARFMGRQADQLQLKFLHVSRRFRKQGLGKLLFEMSAARARELGARRLYISSTPTVNTIGFYFGLGCVLATQVDEVLFELEPEDIHLEYVIPEG